MKTTELDESLWVGGDHKITTQGGKMKFRKRNRSSIPADIKGGQKTGPTANVAMAEKGDSEWRNMTLAKPEDMNWEQFSSTGPKTKEEIAAWRHAKRPGAPDTAKKYNKLVDVLAKGQDSQTARPQPVKEETDATLDSIVERYPTELESIVIGNSSLIDHDQFYNELYEYFVTGAGRGEMPYGVAKAQDGDPDQWITEYLEQEYGRDFDHGNPESMDGDFDSAMASAGHGTDEDYGYYGETSGNQMRKYADIISESSKKKKK